MVTATYDYDAYGNLVSSTGTIRNAIRYAGQWYDGETGFYYLRARYYDPTVGRFTQRDTWPGDTASPYSLNPYLYVENSPLNFTDPTGRCMEDGCLLEIAAVEVLIQTEPEWAPPLEDFGAALLERVAEVADFAAEGDEAAGTTCEEAADNALGGVNRLVDEAGVTRYVGRTNNFALRRAAYRLDPIKGELNFDVLKATGDYATRRGLEQYYYDQYAPELNKIRPISPRNGNILDYLAAALKFLGGN